MAGFGKGWARGNKNPARKKASKKEAQETKGIQGNVNKFFEPPDREKPEWETAGKGLGNNGEHLTLDDLISLKPFESDELGSTIAFRAPEKMLRAAQRIKESSGGIYDIISDLYRQAFAYGLLILSDRHNEVLGMDLVLARMNSYQQVRGEAEQDITEFRRNSEGKEEVVIRSFFNTFMEALNSRPRWVQDIYLAEISHDIKLSAMLKELGEAE